MRNDTPIAWSSPPSEALLLADEIHIWKARLSASSSYSNIPSDEELDRASRFLLERHRVRFVAGRSILRLILGHYLHIDPGQIAFHYQPKGKPALHGTRLRFNVSHSGDLALIAVNLDHEIGIDVERIRSKNLQAIAKRFSRQEQDWLFSQPEEQQSVAFYTIWTLKEAFLKVHGHGLGYPLDQFSVVPHLEERWNLSAWTFAPDETHRAALMISGCLKKLVGFAFTPSLWPLP